MIARASEWTAGEVADSVGGTLRGDPQRRLIGVATDTRDALQEHLFVALRGDRFDAHDFLDRAIEGGAGALLVRRGLAETDLARWSSRASVIEVGDTLFALGELARARRRQRSDLLLIALTGSNGKTSTKEMLAAIVATVRPTLKTEGNLNNLIGLPMTLLGLQAEHRVAVLEMGMNAPGEIARLTEIARPDVGLIVNIGPAHIGELGSQEAVAEAKAELFRGLAEHSVAVINLDDAWVREVTARVAPPRRRTFGRDPAADVRLVSARPELDGEGQQIELAIDGRKLSARLPYPGAHNALNAAAAVAAATARLEIDPEELAAGLAAAGRVGGRLIADAVGPYWLIDDCYNANAASMVAAIDTVADRVAIRGGRLIAILGEMRELGAFSDEEHRRVGRALGARGAALAAVFGPSARPLADGARASGVPAVQYEAEQVEPLFRWLFERLAPGDVILVKGSRGIQMERFIRRLREEVA